MSGSLGAIRIINTFGDQPVTDVSTLQPFNNVTISDPNIGQSETLTVTLSAAANGTLGNLGGGTYNATTGVYTDVGTASAVTAALDGLVFTPTYQPYVAGATVATTLTVTVTDTAGATATDNATTIIASDNNSPKPIGAIFGVDYGPSPGSGGPYPSVAQINADMSHIAQIANTVRIYTMSNGMDYAVTSAIAHGLQVVPSAYLTGSPAQDDTEINNLISELKSLPPAALSKIPFVDIGSDFLTNNPTQLSYLQAEIAKVRTAVPGVSITSSESAATYLVNPGLASSVDLIFPTISPFTAGNNVVTVNNANSYILLQYGQLISAYSSQNVVISEIGWPSSGTIGSAVGSVANEETFWANFIQFAAQNKINYFGFGAFDSATNANTNFSGPNWGLYTSTDTPKGAVITFRPVAPPLLVGTAGGQQTTDAAPISPFSGVTITDPTAGQTETVTVTLSSTSNGTLSNLGSGSYNAGTGVYTVTGTAAAVTTAVDGLKFAPTLHTVPFGQTFTTTFTVVDRDTAGLTAMDSTTTVTVTVTSVVIESAGSTSLLQAVNQYFLQNGAGSTVSLQYNGAQVTTGEFGAWTPIAAEAISGGFEVTWKNGSASQYNVWSTNSAGIYLSTLVPVVSGLDPSLENIEITFQFDLNGDGTIGLKANKVIESNGTTSLWQVGTGYVLVDAGGTGPILKYQGNAVTAGQFGTTVNPVAAAKTQSGFEVAWQITNTNQYIVWNTDANGNYTGSATAVVSAADPSLENIEPTFQFDLNGDGTIGLKANKVIESNGTTSLWQVGTEFVLVGTSGTGPILKYQGNAVTAGQFGAAVNPIAAAKTQSGFEVAWQITNTNQYIVWNTDANGNYTGSATAVVSAADPSLENIEPTFQFDLNGDGTIGLKANKVIESNGTTSLWQVGTEFVLVGTSGTGPILKYQGNAVTAGQFGAAVTPMAAEQTSDGYEVAWQITGANQYIVWNTDTNGNYTGSATAVVSGTDPSLENIEASFQFDLNGDGTIGLKATKVIESAGATSLWQVGNEYVLVANGSNVILQYSGAPVTTGLFGAWTPIAAQATAGGYEVAWQNGSSNQYTVWSTTSGGVWTSGLTGILTGTDPTLKNLETSFQFDINNDGIIGVPPVNSSVGGVVVMLAPVASPVQLGILRSSNTAFASTGLSAPSLSFVGTPDAYTLGPDPTTILYDLAPSSGIETITNFVLGTDDLRIDLMGAANTALQAFDTSVGGTHAIALASSADLTHGVVLLNLPTSQTAADLLASHTVFNNGFAHIS